MLWCPLDAGLCARWVTADTVSGSPRALREGLETRLQAYALAVSCQEQVEVEANRKRVDHLADEVPADQWQPISVGNGSKGPRCFDWTRIALAKPEQAGWQRWLVVRRSLIEGEKPAARAYVLVFAPSGTTLAEMAQAIGTRWTVEHCFEEGKGAVGLDHSEVRDGTVTSRCVCLLTPFWWFYAHTVRCSEKILSRRQKKPWKPSKTLSAFKRQRGLACL